jgi:hypothetical protein
MLHTLYAYLDRSLLALNDTSPKLTLRRISIWNSASAIVIAPVPSQQYPRLQGPAP